MDGPRPSGFIRASFYDRQDKRVDGDSQVAEESNEGQKIHVDARQRGRKYSAVVIIQLIVKTCEVKARSKPLFQLMHNKVADDVRMFSL